MSRTDATESRMEFFGGRSVPRAASLIMVLAIVIGACTGSTPITAPTTAPTGAQSAGPVADPGIPASTVRFALFPCCPDNNISFVGIRKGFYADAGITLSPPDALRLTDSSQNVPTMQRNDADIIMWYIPGNMQTLDTFGFDIQPILYMDVYLGSTILKGPNSGVKSLQDLLDEGMPFADAAAAAVQQLRGKEVWTPAANTVLPQTADVFLSYGDVKPEEVPLAFLEDARIAEQAAAGRIDFALPLSAAIVVQLRNNGWEPVIDFQSVFANDPGSVQKDQLTLLIGSTGMSAQRSFIEEHHDTVLRFMSAFFRGVNYTFDPATQQEALQIVADNVNAGSGTTLTAADILGVYQEVDPFFPYEVQGTQLWDEGAPFHVLTATSVQVQDLIDRGTIPDKDYDIEGWIAADDLYRELKEYQTKADELFTTAAAAALSPDRQALVDRARELYDAYNFLDAFRYLEAAIL